MNNMQCYLSVWCNNYVPGNDAVSVLTGTWYRLNGCQKRSLTFKFCLEGTCLGPFSL
jgi:hypothetical protein